MQDLLVLYPKECRRAFLHANCSLTRILSGYLQRILVDTICLTLFLVVFSLSMLCQKGGIDAGVYVKAVQYLYYFYGIGCFASPGTMVTAHFDQPEPEASTKFWIRGSSVPIMATAYLLGLLDTDVAVKVAAVTTLLTGIVYPWNAKLGYFTGIDMKCKKIHMFPEISFLVLTILGALAVTGGGSVADAI